MRKETVHEIRCSKAKQTIKFFIFIIFTMLLKIHTLSHLIKVPKTGRQASRHAGRQTNKQTVSKKKYQCISTRFSTRFFSALSCILVLHFLYVLLEDFDMLFNNSFMLIDSLSLFVFKYPPKKKNQTQNHQIKTTKNFKQKTKQPLQQKKKKQYNLFILNKLIVVAKQLNSRPLI